VEFQEGANSVVVDSTQHRGVGYSYCETFEAADYPYLNMSYNNKDSG